jgi:hypothetical protein
MASQVHLLSVRGEPFQTGMTPGTVTKTNRSRAHDAEQEHQGFLMRARAFRAAALVASVAALAIAAGAGVRPV